MSGSDYLVLGYVLGLLVLVGYAINLWVAGRRLGNRKDRGS